MYLQVKEQVASLPKKVSAALSSTLSSQVKCQSVSTVPKAVSTTLSKASSEKKELAVSPLSRAQEEIFIQLLSVIIQHQWLLILQKLLLIFTFILRLLLLLLHQLLLQYLGIQAKAILLPSPQETQILLRVPKEEESEQKAATTP